MHIILLSNSWNPSSIEKTHCFAVSMARSAISVKVIPLCQTKEEISEYTLRYPSPRKYDFISGVNGMLWEGRNKLAKLLNNIKISFGFARRLYRQLKHQKSEAIILPQGALEMNFPAIILGRLFKVPVLGNIMEYKPAFHSYRNINSKLEWWLIANCCNGYFLISQFLMEQFGTVQRKMYLPVLIESDHIKAVETDFQEESAKPIFLYTNSPAYLDLLFFCLEALDRVDLSFELVVTGRYNKMSALKDKIKKCGLDGQVRFTGYISDEEMERLQRNSAALLVPLTDDIQHVARFPQKILNYMLLSKPVISSNVGEIPYFFKDGQSALIDHQKSTQGFSDKIRFFLENPKTGVEIGRHGRRVVLEQFSVEAWGGRIKSFIAGMQSE